MWFTDCVASKNVVQQLYTSVWVLSPDGVRNHRNGQNERELTIFYLKNINFAVQNDYFIQSFQYSWASSLLYASYVLCIGARCQTNDAINRPKTEDTFISHIIFLPFAPALPPGYMVRPIVCPMQCLSNKFIYFSPQVCGLISFHLHFFFLSFTLTFSAEQWRWSRLLYHSLQLTARPKKCSIGIRTTATVATTAYVCAIAHVVTRVMNTQSLRRWLVIFYHIFHYMFSRVCDGKVSVHVSHFSVFFFYYFVLRGCALCFVH